MPGISVFSRLPSWDGAADASRPRTILAPPTCRDFAEVSGLQVPSDREGAFHLVCLKFALGTLPMSLDVGCHFERRVPEMARQPGDLGTSLKRWLRKRVPETVKCSFLMRRADALRCLLGSSRDRGAGGGEQSALETRGRRRREIPGCRQGSCFASPARRPGARRIAEVKG